MPPRPATVAALALVCLSGLAAAHPPDDLAIAGVYPNPVADGDAGEFVVLSADAPTHLANWTLRDDEGGVALPNRTVEGRVVLSTAPDRTRERVDARVLALPGGLELANGGEPLALGRRGRTVQRINYTDAPEGERGTVTSDGLAWAPLGRTDFPVVRGSGGTVRAFVLPDSPAVPIRTLRSADARILLAGYTLTSRRVADALVAARERGVAVRVLVDGGPVGGLTRRQARVLDRLVAANVSVTALGGPRASYRFHHAKYAVVDDRALVTTENWKPAGTGGHSSRGWGVVVRSPAVVSALAETFRADAAGPGSRPWPAFAAGETFTPAAAPPANATFPTRVPSRAVRAASVELLRAPDNAERRVVALLDNATTSIRVQQVSIGSRTQPFLRAVLRAARRGVRVRVLLSGAWYVREDNAALVAWLNRVAAREGLPLSARVADPGGRYEKIHAKGLVVDGEHVLVGSLNWNNNSVRENREVALLLHGTSVADYYRDVFHADWRGGIWLVPVGLLGLVVLAAGVAVLVGRRIEFAGDTPPRVGP
ncbi:MAG: phospholipase D-like domain-containing protein [Haloglomus sp.]